MIMVHATYNIMMLEYYHHAVYIAVQVKRAFKRSRHTFSPLASPFAQPALVQFLLASTMSCHSFEHQNSVQAPGLDAQLCSHAVRAARVSASLPSRGSAARAVGTAV